MVLRLLLLLLPVFFVVGLAPVPAQGERSFPAKVRKVRDGDSILVEKEGASYEIRLYGIDAPEYHQLGGREARFWLQENIAGKTVGIRVINRDRYDRLVAIVTSAGKNINEELVALGLVQVYDRYCRQEICKHWKQQQRVARQKRWGLWRQRHPVSPWIWRHRHGRKS